MALAFQRAKGSLSLGFAASGGQTRIQEVYQADPCRVMMPARSGAAGRRLSQGEVSRTQEDFRSRPFIFANLKAEKGVAEIAEFILKSGGLRE